MCWTDLGRGSKLGGDCLWGSKSFACQKARSRGPSSRLHKSAPVLLPACGHVSEPCRPTERSSAPDVGFTLSLSQDVHQAFSSDPNYGALCRSTGLAGLIGLPRCTFCHHVLKWPLLLQYFQTSPVSFPNALLSACRHVPDPDRPTGYSGSPDGGFASLLPFRAQRWEAQRSQVTPKAERCVEALDYLV